MIRGKCPRLPRNTRGEKKEERMLIENFCRRVSGVEKAQKKAAVLFEAGMDTSLASKTAGLYEALLKARLLEIRFYLALKIPAMMCCGVGTGAFFLLLYLRGHNVLLVLSACAALAGTYASEWLRRKIWVTETKICRLDSFLSKKSSA